MPSTPPSSAARPLHLIKLEEIRFSSPRASFVCRMRTDSDELQMNRGPPPLASRRQRAGTKAVPRRELRGSHHMQPQPSTKASRKLSRLIRCDISSSVKGCLGKGLGKTHATLSWRANSSEISSPTQHPLTYHSSPRAREARNLLAAPLEQNTGNTPSPWWKKVWSDSMPVGSRRAIR